MKSAVGPPVALPQQYVYMTTNGGDQGKVHGMDAVRDPHPHQQMGVPNLAGGIVIDLNSNPYYTQPHAHVYPHPHGISSQQPSNERIAMDAKLMQTQTQFGHVTTVAHTVVQIGLS